MLAAHEGLAQASLQKDQVSKKHLPVIIYIKYTFTVVYLTNSSQGNWFCAPLMKCLLRKFPFIHVYDFGRRESSAP